MPTHNAPASHPSTQPTSERLNYLLECFKTAREELLFRVQHRDIWLKTQLYIQAILFSVSNGIKLLGTESLAAAPKVLCLALPISSVLMCLYLVEDKIIRGLSEYLSSLSEVEKKITKGEFIIESWDNSTAYSNYRLQRFNGLHIRITAQIIAFIIIPLALFGSYANGFSTKLLDIMITLLQISSLSLIIPLIINGYKNRKNQPSTEQANVR